MFGIGEIGCIVGETFHEEGSRQKSQLIVNLEPVQDWSIKRHDSDDVDYQRHPGHLCDDHLKPLAGAKEGDSNR